MRHTWRTATASCKRAAQDRSRWRAADTAILHSQWSDGQPCHLSEPFRNNTAVTFAVMTFKAHQASMPSHNDVGSDNQIAQGDLCPHVTAEDFLKQIIFTRAGRVATILGVAKTFKMNI